MKHQVPTILALVGVALIVAFLSWAFAQHGTAGLLKVNAQFRWVFLALGIIGIILLAFAVLFQWTAAGDWQWLKITAVIISLPAIIIPPAAFVVTSGIFSPGIGDTPPQVLMADGTGMFGVPDMAVVFNTKAANKNTLKWWQGSVMVKIEEDKPSQTHVFMLRNLKADAAYWYQINEGEPVSFTTPPVSGTLHFAVASDTHYGAGTALNDYTASMLGEIASPANDYNMLFIIGDFVEYGFQRNQWRQAFEAFSKTTSIIPTRFAIGNHDTLFSGYGNSLNYCYPEGMDVQTGSRLWYRLDVGKVHFLVVDVEWSAESFTDTQAAWLEEQLKNIPADDWKIVMSHGFYYASGLRMDGWNWYDNPETIEKLIPIFNKYGVDIVFSGHIHRMELLQNSGVVYAVCAPSGGLPDPPATYISPSSIWDGTGERGFIDVSLEGEQCTLVFRDQEYKALKTHVFNRK